MPPILIRPDPEDGGYIASCPSLPGCHSQGETVDEALANIGEAISLVLEVAPPEGVAAHLKGEVFVTDVEVAFGSAARCQQVLAQLSKDRLIPLYPGVP